MLTLLAVTLIFTEEEERTDRILKQMVDAVKGGRGKAAVAAFEQEQSQLSRSDYERIVREQMDKKILEVMSDKDDDALRRIALDLVYIHNVAPRPKPSTATQPKTRVNTSKASE
jgi:hypothetical protein